MTRRVPTFFSNLLPEGHLRTYLARKAGVNPEREFFLLAALGHDLPGGVTVGAPAVIGEEPLQTDGGPLRFSLAGVQLKFSAIAEATGGLTIPAHGVGGSWIVKLPSTHFPAVCENEFAMLELARAIGIDVPTLRLTPLTDIDGLPKDVAQMTGTRDRQRADQCFHGQGGSASYAGAAHN